ncbi:MAG: choice-of-anchor Q domain-containing protein [Cyanobacteria bacterium J06621_11]
MSIIYVKQGATGSGDGSSWADAYTDLAGAIANAANGDEIWLAEGTYVPGAARTDTFSLTKEIAIYGGFSGSETNRSDRDWQNNLTILSGEIGSANDNSDNSHHVVTSNSNAIATLDGVIIESGNTQGAIADDGGGVFNDKGTLTLKNTIVRNNQSADDGAGLRNSGTLFLINAAVTDNVSIGTSFTSGGGGLLNDQSGTATIINSTFSGNIAQNGGAIRNDGLLSLHNTTLSGNRATFQFGGGGAIANSTGTVEILNSTITNNVAAGSGAGISTTSAVTVANSIIAANQDDKDVAAVSALGQTGSFTSNGNNLIGNGGTGNGFTNGTNGDQVGTSAAPISPLLETLQNNGGFTQTHAPGSGSTAIDAGNNSFVATDIGDVDADSNTTEPIPFDPNGTIRILNGTVDIGAVESKAGINQAVPTVTLQSVLTAVDENIAIAERLKVANIAIADGDSGTNTLSLAGTNADLFSIDGTALFLNANTALNFETQSQLEVDVQVDDPAVGATPDSTVTYRLGLNDVNEAPTAIALQSVSLELAENADTTRRIKLTDIVVTDDAKGKNALTISGTNASLFEIEGTGLFLRAATSLNGLSQTQFNATVEVSDADFGTQPQATVNFVLDITGENAAPTNIVLENVTAALPENVDVSSPIKLADIAVADDGVGTNVLKVVGRYAQLFEAIEAEELKDILDEVLDNIDRSDFDDLDTDALRAIAADVLEGLDLDAISLEALSRLDLRDIDTDALKNIADEVLDAIDQDALQAIASDLLEKTADKVREKIDANAFDEIAEIDVAQLESLANEVADAIEAGTLDSLNLAELEGFVSDVLAAVDTDALDDIDTDALEALAEEVVDAIENDTLDEFTLEDVDTDALRDLAAEVLNTVDADALKNTATEFFALLDTEVFEIVGTELFLKAGADLDYETRTQYDVTLQVDDAAIGSSPDAAVDFSLAITDVEELLVSAQANQLLNLAREVGDTQLSLSIEQINTRQVNEIVVAITDDQGRINGLLPDEAGYLEAFIAQSEVVFSVLEAGEFDLDLSRVLDVTGNTSLQFAVIEGGSLDGLQTGGQGSVRLASAIAVNADDQSGSLLRIDQLSDTSLRLGFDLGGSGDFEDVVLRAVVGDAIAPIGSALQGGSESELFDLREVTGAVTATFEVYREAQMNNTVGFFKVENAAGDVLDDRGNLLGAGAAGYVQAAMQRRVDVDLTGQNGQLSTYTVGLAGGQLLSSFIVSDGSVEALLDRDSSSDPAIYFTHIGANSDGRDHVRLLGDNIFGFEDTVGGGDQDFDDIVIKASFA